MKIVLAERSKTVVKDLPMEGDDSDRLRQCGKDEMAAEMAKDTTSQDVLHKIQSLKAKIGVLETIDMLKDELAAEKKKGRASQNLSKMEGLQTKIEAREAIDKQIVDIEAKYDAASDLANYKAACQLQEQLKAAILEAQQQVDQEQMDKEVPKKEGGA